MFPHPILFAMPGLDPGIHVLLSLDKKGVDGRVKPGAMTKSAPFQRRHKERRISNSAILVGRAPRLFEEFIDQGLTDALGHILINRFERLAHR